MLLNVTGSTIATRKLVTAAAWWYAEKLMGNRLINNMEISVKIDKNLFKNSDCEGTAIWEDDNYRPKEFTIEIDSSCKIRDILITLAHEMVHVKQWAKDEMYEYLPKGKLPKDYMNSPNMVRFKGEKMCMDNIDYWDYPWEIEAYGRQLGLFRRFCEDIGIANRENMKEDR
jgi:hypothetical protein